MTPGLGGLSGRQVERLTGYVRDSLEALRCPGGALVVVDRAGRERAVSFGDLDEGTPVPLGSASKAITGALVLQLAEDGALSTSEPAARLLPGNDLHPKVTLGDLAHHRSGLRADSTPGRHRHRRDRSFHYANENYNLLGRAIAAAAGRPFPEQLAARIVEPLGMRDTFCLGVTAPGRAVDSARPARGRTGFFGLPLPAAMPPMDETSWIQAPSGGICASMRDAARFLRMLLNGGDIDRRRVLGRDCVLRALRDVVPAGGSPAVAGVFGSAGEYGFGWVRKQHAGQDLHIHTGKVPGFTTAFALLPERGLAMAFATNLGDMLVTTPLVEKLVEGIVLFLSGEGAPALDRGACLWRRACVTGAHLAFLAATCAAWFAPPRRMRGRVVRGILAPTALAAGVRGLGQAPWPWIPRFAPDTTAVVAIRVANLVGSALPRP